jgi:hypothetical protein
MFKDRYFGEVLLDATMIILIVLVIGGLVVGVFATMTRVEVEVYTVGAEVSQMAYAEESVSRSSSRPVYKMGVRNDEFAHTFDITDTQFAKYAVGDVVEVEVTIWEYFDGEFVYEYKLIG